ncbi:chorismate mutase [Caldanaerobacter sp.]|uniref:chorismate mutase n=1 Tax=Caldanaerobacter sp. TaxID=2930036 RepID=UPI003C75C23F
MKKHRKGEWAIRVIRGATTTENTKDAIFKDTVALIEEILKRNNLKKENLISIFFSATKDLNAAYPAEAVRKEMGFDDVPMMCFQEMEVMGSLSKCIRVAVFTNIEESQKINHVYLKEAKNLRPDLA